MKEAVVIIVRTTSKSTEKGGNAGEYGEISRKQREVSDISSQRTFWNPQDFSNLSLKISPFPSRSTENRRLQCLQHL